MSEPSTAPAPKASVPKILEIDARGLAIALRCDGFDEITLHGGSAETLASEVASIAKLRGCQAVIVHGGEGAFAEGLRSAGLSVTEDKAKA